MNILMSTPGRFHTFKVAAEFEKMGLLRQIYSTYPKSKIIGRENVSESLITLYPIAEYLFRGTAFITKGKFPRIESLACQAKHEILDRSVSHALHKYSKLQDVIYQGQSSAQSSSLKVAKQLGYHTVVERASSHVLFQNNYLRDEYQPYHKQVFSYQPQWFVDKELEEYELADKILVPTNFVKKTFVDYGVSPEKIWVLPFGTNLDTGKSAAIRTPLANRTVKLLFVGNVSIRKGIPYLLKAFRELNNLYNVELTLVGSVENECLELLKEYSDNVTAYGIVPHTKLGEIYSTHDLFVFPSLEEGLAMVQLEALSYGLPVITTPNAGGEEIVVTGNNGIIIEPKSVDSIVNAVRDVISGRYDAKDMSNNAYAFSNSQSWEKYAYSLSQLYRTIL